MKNWVHFLPGLELRWSIPQPCKCEDKGIGEGTFWKAVG